MARPDRSRRQHPLIARFRQGLHESEVIAAAMSESIGLDGILGFYTGEPPQQGLLFGYGGIDADSINVALGRLAVLLPGLARG